MELSSQRREFDHTLACDEQLRRDQLLLHEQLSEQNRDLREAHIKSLREMEELKRVQELRIDESSRRRLTENQDTFHELTARIQELQNEGMPSRSGGLLSRNDKPPDIWSMHGISGNVFVNPPASSSFLCSGGFNPWISNVTEDRSPHVTSERQNPDTTLDPRGQSGPSARNSFDRSEGRCSKNYGADHQRLQISVFHSDKFSNPTTFACWKIRFKTEVCTCSQFPTEAMLWIKEVEMVESADDLKSSRSIRGIRTPDFEVLDAKIASALNKIIQNTRFKEKISLEEMKAQKEDRLLDLRVLPGHWSQRFCRELCRPIDSCSSKR